MAPRYFWVVLSPVAGVALAALGVGAKFGLSWIASAALAQTALWARGLDALRTLASAAFATVFAGFLAYLFRVAIGAGWADAEALMATSWSALFISAFFVALAFLTPLKVDK